jgi:SAM-dependent methyltransferase
VAHAQELAFVDILRQNFPTYFTGRKVLEIGSLNISGSVRQFFTDCDYTGIDVAPGKDVDRVMRGEDCSDPAGQYDVIITCEMMEHNERWQATWLNMLRLLQPAGLLIMTCASYGRRQHGTPAYEPEASPLTADQGRSYYRNLGEEDLQSLANLDTWFAFWTFFRNYASFDLYFYGIGRDGDPRHVNIAKALKLRYDQYYWQRNMLGEY